MHDCDSLLPRYPAGYGSFRHAALSVWVALSAILFPHVAWAGKPKLVVELPRSSAYPDCFSDDELFAAEAVGDQSIAILNVKTGELLRTIVLPGAKPKEGIVKLSLSSNGKILTSLATDQQVSKNNRLDAWDVNGWTPHGSIASESFQASSLMTLSPDGSKAIIYERFSRVASIWDLKAGIVIGKISTTHAIIDCLLSSDEKKIVIVDHDEHTAEYHVCVFEFDKLSAPSKKITLYHAVTPVGLRADGAELAYFIHGKRGKASFGYLSLDKPVADERVVAIQEEMASAWRLGVAIGGKFVASASSDRKTVYVYDTWKGLLRYEIPVPEQAQKLVLGSGGLKLMICATRGTTIWDLEHEAEK